MILGTSVALLKKRCGKIFKPQSTVYMVANGDLIWPEEKFVDVILMGNPLGLITHRYLWPKGIKIRLWVLSEAFKKLLVAILNIDPKHIAVVPRYILFPQKKPAQSYDLLNSDIELIYSGRFTIEKNFPLTVQVANRIQNLANGRITFNICGPRLTSNNQNLKLIKEEISKYQWKTKPQIKEDLGTFLFQLTNNPEHSCGKTAPPPIPQ